MPISPKKARDRFIPGYFMNTTVDEMKKFLDNQLGEIESEDISLRLIKIREELRATGIIKFFAKYDSSQEPAEEPTQWEAMKHPFDSHLLVNAGPGSGKTSVLVGRIIHLIHEQKIKPSEIIVLAFNRAVVFEIRNRIRDLFQSLGYAAYASQVRVSTFHSLAMRSLYDSDTPPESAYGENILKDFADRLVADKVFRQNVAGKCSCILVDEFQDMNEEVYSIIRNLHEGSSIQPGVMAIGDDDQDILRWNRESPGEGNKAFAELYFKKFKEDFGGAKLKTLELGVNFRSGVDIVKESQEFIQNFFVRNKISERLKKNRLCTKKDTVESKCKTIDSREWTWDQTLENVAKTSHELLANNKGSIAILCRTNEEVASVHRKMANIIPNLVVQNNENISIKKLRHVALWIDFLETEIVQQDQALSASLFNDLFKTFCADTDIPEIQSGVAETDFSTLWKLCIEENPYPHLSTLFHFMKAMKSDDLQRILGAHENVDEAVVSTIHKVKGLEYDNVIILPSRASFPFKDSSSDIKADAAEEARLFYVAMTRAKSQLVCYIGEREICWEQSQPQPFNGVQGKDKILTGTPKQINIGWPMRISDFNGACSNPEVTQKYIETKVAIGDKLECESGDNKKLFHTSKFGEKFQIGCISNKFVAKSPRSELKVSSIIRYPSDENNPKYSNNKYTPCVTMRGWGYVVLVEERKKTWIIK